MSKLNMINTHLEAAQKSLLDARAALASGFSQEELIALLAAKQTANETVAAPIENKADVAESVAPKKNGNGNGNGNGKKKEKKEQKSKYVGQEIEYGGGRAKITGRSDEGGFTARALSALNYDDKERERGYEFDVSNTYVYKQLKSSKK